MNIEKLLRENYTYMDADEIMAVLKKINVENVIEKYLNDESRADLEEQLSRAEAEISDLEEQLEEAQEEVEALQKELDDLEKDSMENY